MSNSERTDADDQRHAELVEHFVRRVQDDELCLQVDGSVAAEIMRHIDLSGVIRAVVDRLVELLEEEGFCTLDFHVSQAEWFPDGRCESCGEQREHSNHHSVIVCTLDDCAAEHESSPQTVDEAERHAREKTMTQFAGIAGVQFPEEKP